MRRFYIDPRQISGDTVELTEDESRHLCTVLRLEPGDEIELVDGSGYAYSARIRSTSGSRVQAVVKAGFRPATESALKLTLAMGFLKEKKMDLLVRHLTELGITRFQPLWTERAIARPPQNRLDSRMDRWQSIAREAVKQSRRALVPEIARPVSYDEVLHSARPSQTKIIFWENARQSITGSLDPEQGSRDALVMIGPEGGFSEKEGRAAIDCGFIPVLLGPRILRAETAAITACALLQFLFGDMDKKSP